MKDLGPLCYFLGIEVDSSPTGTFLSQHKYTFDLLSEYGVRDTKPLKLPLDSHLKIHLNIGDPLPHPVYYQQLVGKLIYFTIIRPDIAFTVQILMHKPT